VPVPLKPTETVAFVDELLLIVSVPVTALAAVGANLTCNVMACFGLSVTGKVAPDTVKPVPLIVAELTVTALVPLEVNVTPSVALEPTATSPKLKLVGLTVSVDAPVPVPLRLTATAAFAVELLVIASEPVAALAAVGANFTVSDAVCFGFSVKGKVTPEIVKPVPLSEGALTVTAAVPVEVKVTGNVALDPNATLPKFRLVGLTVNNRVLVVVPAPLRLTVLLALAEEVLLTVNAPATVPVVTGANFTWSVTVCCGLRVSGKEAPVTLNPVPLIVAELIFTATAPVEVKVTGKVELEPTVTLPKLRLPGLTVNCGVDAEPETGTAANVAICMTQGPAEFSVAVALLLPAAVTTLSSAISPSGEVMIREVNPLPAPAVSVDTVFAPKISSLALLVVAAPLLALALFPLAPAVISSAVTPRYSRMRTSGYAAAWLNVTVTVLPPPAIFDAK
jgi:hypothetical protein